MFFVGVNDVDPTHERSLNPIFWLLAGKYSFTYPPDNKTVHETEELTQLLTPLILSAETHLKGTYVGYFMNANLLITQQKTT